MELIERKNKNEYNEDIKKLINIFKFDKINLELKGSSVLKIIDYYADYDFFCSIWHNYSENEIFAEFKRILAEILNNNNTYFIEFKTQKLNDKKKKWFPNQNFEYKVFEEELENIDYCKIDIIYFSEEEKRFIEASCIYKFGNKKLTKEDYLKEIKEETKELKKEKNYYKVLKREFLKYKILKDNNKLDFLINIFNSELGKIYKDINNIDAIEKVKEYYGDEPLTKKRIELNLDEIKYYKNYKQLYDKNKKYLNEEAKKLYNQL